MKKCCHETYISVLQEIIQLIEEKKIETIPQLVGILIFAIKELRKMKL